jgi:hypothetical protein
MAWPLSQDYNEAVQNPATSFADPDLRAAQPALNTLGMPLPRSGNFADVYELRGAGGARWAVKCFTREIPRLRERYAQIAEHLGRAGLPFVVEFQYVEQGIRVGSSWYPVLKMRWVEGYLLNEFVRDNLGKPEVLSALGRLWPKMGRRLRKAQVAHADLQHGNVLLVPGSTPRALALKLIDYDGMWVPTLAHLPSHEVGHPAYQHPKRLAQGIYSSEVDRVPLLVVACALRALELCGRPLWDRYDNGDNLLFRPVDLAAPGQSALFRELWEVPDRALHHLLVYLVAALTGSLAEVPLLENVWVDGNTRPPDPAQEQEVAATLGGGPALTRPTPAKLPEPAILQGILVLPASVPGSHASRSTLGGAAPRQVSTAAAATFPLEGGRTGDRGSWRMPLVAAACGVAVLAGLAAIIGLASVRESPVKPDELAATQKDAPPNAAPGKKQNQQKPGAKGPQIPPPPNKPPLPNIPPNGKQPARPKPQPKPPAKRAPRQRPKWVSLFNGKDLTDWKFLHPGPDNWKVKNGILIGEGPEGTNHLISQRGNFRNFCWRFEARINDGGLNVQVFRAQDTGPGLPEGYCTQCNGGHPDVKEQTGTLFLLKRPAPDVALEYGQKLRIVHKKLVKPNEWFTQEVVARDNHITVFVNDEKVVDYTDRDNHFKKGHFALQALRPQHARYTKSRVEFRKIEVMDLPKAKGRGGP